MTRHTSAAATTFCTAATFIAAAVAVLWADRACPQSADSPYAANSVAMPQDDPLWQGYEDPGIRLLTQPPGPDSWTFDLCLRSSFSSRTSYQFGTPPEASPGWSPLSRLDFSLNSLWYGLQLAHETPRTALQLQWCMAGTDVNGHLADYDWAPPNADGSYTDLGFASEYMNQGQMFDISYRYQPFEGSGGLPIEIWPLIGFRWQYFDLTAYGLDQVESNNVPLAPPFTYADDVLTFNQQYYTGYAGVMFRGKLGGERILPLAWSCQADYGYTEARDTDHHLLRAGDMYIRNATHGYSSHLGASIEAFFGPRASIGVQGDYLDVNSSGVHRWLNAPLGVDETWSDGVSVSSRQMWLTLFLRFRF